MDEIIAKVTGCRITPMGLQQYIRTQTGTRFHITYVRKIMHLYNLPPKVAQKIHINRAGRKAVWNWRYYLKRQISYLEKEGFAMIMQDEAFFVHDTVSGRKYWSPKGRRISVPYTGSHRKVTIYGSLALGRPTALSDVRPVQCRHVCCLPQRAAEAFWKGSADM